MSSDLRDVLSEDISTLISEHTPEVLDQRLTEENQTLSATVFKVDIEVVLLDAREVRTKLVLNLLNEAPLPSDLRRLYKNVKSHLVALF